MGDTVMLVIWGTAYLLLRAPATRLTNAIYLERTNQRGFQAGLNKTIGSDIMSSKW